MKKTSTLFIPTETSREVSTHTVRRQPRPSTIAKLCQLARCAFATGKSMPLIILI